MKVKDYRGATESALKAQPGGARDFLLGMAAARLGEWEDTLKYLGKGAGPLPILADYSTYYSTLALYRLGRHAEALAELESFAKNYPESPLGRSADKLKADLLHDSGNIPAAATSYLAFIEKYPTGSDALEALQSLALCREKMGDLAGAVATLRSIWLKYPSSPVAAKADEELHRLAAAGTVVPPFSAEELLQRAAVLIDLRRFTQAIKALGAIPLAGEPDDFAWRLLFKTGQAQFKARRYRDAEHTFSDLLSRNPRRDVVDDASYWLAKSLDKNGREEEAYATYIKLAETSPRSSLADDALLAAAFIRKFQRKSGEELSVMRMLVQKYPRSRVARTALWEIAWTSYQAGDLKTAAAFFQKLVASDATRDKALYWYGRTLAAAGDEKGASQAFATLAYEFPFGFYALSCKQGTKTADDQSYSLPADLCALLPLPGGFERAKSLIALGLYEEAAKELAAARRKSSDRNRMLPGLARLYLEMGDFHAAFSLLRDKNLAPPGKNTMAEWGIAYPLAFREEVAANSRQWGIPQSLIFAVMRAESNYFPKALSPAGAVGLMQVMPATAAVAKGGGERCDIDHLLLPGLNIRMGVRHLKDLLALYGGDEIMAVAAYNAGSGNVNRWRKTFGKLPKEVFIENIPFPETREYVKKVLSWAEIYRRLYRLDAPPLPGTDVQQPLSKGAPPKTPLPSSLGETPSNGTRDSL
ncbi:MAG TPA: transglycosylase SLT domain-containing protein [Geobacteraceae bacterium]